MRGGPQPKVSLRPSKERWMYLGSLYRSSVVREGAIPHQSWERLSYRQYETSLISSNRAHSNADLQRRVDLELQVQEAAIGC